jgi:ABC-type transporter Mla subunit MlaD
VTAPANRWKLGLFVVAGFTASVAALTWIGMSELQKEYRVAYAYFDEAVNGLEEGSPVKFRGVTIGVVDEIRVAPDQKHLRVQAALYDDKLARLGLHAPEPAESAPLPSNLRAQIVMSWVTSTAFIQVDFFPDPPTGPQQLPFPVEERTMRTVKSTAKSLEDASREVLRELPSIATSARELVELLRTELQGARISDLSRQVQAVLLRFDRTLEELQTRGTIAAGTSALQRVGDAADAVAGSARSLQDDQSPFGSTLAELRGLAQEAQKQLAAMQIAATVAGVRTVTSEAGDLSRALQSELPQLRAALAAVERLATLLERDPGALLHGRAAVPSPLPETRR